MTSTTKESFLICITIIEGKLFAIANMHSAVQVRIDRQKRTTSVRKGTDCPYYNEVLKLNKPIHYIKKHIFLSYTLCLIVLRIRI